MTSPLAAGLVARLAAGSLAGCTGDRAGFRDPGVPLGSFRLVAFDSCERRWRSAGRGQGGRRAVRLHGGGRRHRGPRTAAAGRRPAPPSADAAQAGRRRPTADRRQRPDYSGTNTHEAGVDEPDLVKTDGQRIVTVSGGHAAGRRRGQPARSPARSTSATPPTASLRTAGDLLLAGDHALVLSPAAYATRRSGRRRSRAGGTGHSGSGRRDRSARA